LRELAFQVSRHFGFSKGFRSGLSSRRGGKPLVAVDPQDIPGRRANDFLGEV